MSTSFWVYSNTYATDPSLEQGDSFTIHSNAFATEPLVEQGDSRWIYSYLATSNSSNVITFFYEYTRIDDIVPDPAPLPGGVTIIGVQLDKVKTVYIDGKKASFKILSPTQIYAGLPLNVSSTTVDVYVEYE